MRKFTALLLAALVLVGANIALADKTITLDKDTKLVLQGWTVADDIKFKKNTVVKLNDDGQVIEGVLASATYLRPAGWKSLASNYYYVERSAPFFPPRFFYHPYRRSAPSAVKATGALASSSFVLPSALCHRVFLFSEPLVTRPVASKEMSVPLLN